MEMRTGSDQAEATLGDLMDALCEVNMTLSIFKESGAKCSRSGVTLAQILGGVAGLEHANTDMSV